VTTKIVIAIQHAEKKPCEKKLKQHEQPKLLDKVAAYIDLVKSDQESAKEWYYLQRLYERLCQCRKLTKEQEQILYWLEPLMAKFGHGDPHNAVKYDGSKMLRGKDHLGKGER
jgi:hypothetical protein